MKVALIGAGYMGRLHAEKFAARADCKLVAIADRDGARAEALAQRLGSRAFDDWRLAIREAHAVVVAVPTEAHLEVAGGALEAGKHVLVEKPIAVTLQEADALVSRAAKKQLVLQIGHVERYNAAFSAMAKRMAQPVFIDADRLSAFKQRGADVDVVLDLMIHDLDLSLALARAPVREVKACGFRVLTEDIDIANARIEFEDGCVANLSASRVSQAPVRKLRVFQTDLYVSADLHAGKLRYVREVNGAVDETEEAYSGGDALAVQATAFIDAVLNRRSPPVSGEDGRRALAVALEVATLVRERLGNVT